MYIPGLIRQRDFRNLTIILALIALVYLIIIVFAFGGDLFIFSLSSSINAPLAILVTILAASSYRYMDRKNQSRRLWIGFIFGWGLWALAETLWVIYSLIGQEPPYPGWADLFWVVGYIPLFYGLISRIRSLPSRVSPRRQAAIWILSLLILVVTSIYVFAPILQYFDPEQLIVSLLDFIYPLADLGLATLVLVLFFTYEKGDFGFTWRLLAVGYLLMTFSDFMFTYATWQEIYYPEMQANLISRLFTDAPYTLSYFLWVLGIFGLRLLLKKAPAIEKVEAPARIPFYGHILLSTRSDDTFIHYSPNADKLFLPETILGSDLSRLLQIPVKDGQAILAKIMEEGRLADLPIIIHKIDGSPVTLKLCGIVVRDHNSNYVGCNFLLRVMVDDYLFDDPLSEESRSLIRYLLEKSGSSHSAERGNYLLDYHILYMKELIKLIDHEGGEGLVASLVDELKKASAEKEWKLLFNTQTGLSKANYPLLVLQIALPALLERARAFAANEVGIQVVEARMQEVSAQMDESFHKDAIRFLKEKADI